MCWTCGCLQPENTHGDHRNLTTDALTGAAGAAHVTVEKAVTNIMLTLRACGTAVKEADPEVAPDAMWQVIKARPERQFTLGLAYPAWRPDVSRAADGYRDFVSADVLEKTAHTWLHKYGDVNLHHQEGTLGHFTPAESYIWRAPDWTLESPVDGSRITIKSGDWLLGGYWDDHAWGEVKAGRVNGWSPEGGAHRVRPTTERLAQLRR